MISITTRGVEQTAARLERAVGETRTAMERAVSRSSQLLSRETKLQLSGARVDDPFLGRKGSPAPFLGSRTNAARTHITPGGQVFRSGNTVFSAVGSPDRYVAKHEYGGRISGRPYLRIPLDKAQTSSGVDREMGHSVRDRDDLILVRSRAGNFFLARYKRRGNPKRLNKGLAIAAAYRSGPPRIWPGLDLLYLLKRSVTLPPRRMFQTVRERVAPKVYAMTNGEVETVMRKANNG